MVKNRFQKILTFLRKKYRLLILVFFVLLYLSVWTRQALKPLPEGLSFASKNFITKSENIRFLSDLSFRQEEQTIKEQEIFDTILARIDQAEHYILIDMFLFNGLMKDGLAPYRNLSSELAQSLVQKKTNSPSIKIDLISDPINTVYGSHHSPEIQALRDAGINVIISDLSPLRDSNPLYSSLWRLSAGLFGTGNKGWLKNPFGANGDPVTLRSYLSLLNFKANHRKAFLADNKKQMVSIISSANPHDGSSGHSNAGIEIRGEFWQSLWYAESAVAALSGAKLQSPPIFDNPSSNNPGDHDISVSLLTESKIKEALLQAIEGTRIGEEIFLAIFYFSDRDLIHALLKADQRGVNIRLIMDPNKDAFGYEKIGIPNRQVARELRKKSDARIKIRWYDTRGEQFHTKLAYIAHHNGPSRVILGSANFTRRNLDDYNLESDVQVIAPGSSIFVQDAKTYLERIWNNLDASYSLDYAAYADDSILKYLIYRFQEWSGLSSF